MRGLQVSTGIAATILLAACASSPPHAPIHGTVTGKARLESSALRARGRQPGRWHVPGTAGACGRSVSAGTGAMPAGDAPCTQYLLVPVVARGSRPGRPRVEYRRRPCWCGGG